MGRLAGITVGLVLLSAPTAAYAADSDVSSNPIVNITEIASQGLVTTAWSMTGLVALLGMGFIPSIASRSKVRRTVARENLETASKIEDTFESSFANLETDYNSLVSRVETESSKYGEASLTPAVTCVRKVASSLSKTQELRVAVPPKKRTVEHSEIRLQAVQAIVDSIASTKETIKEGNSCVDYVIASEKAYREEAEELKVQLQAIAERKTKIEGDYAALAASFDEDYIAGAKSEIGLMAGYIAKAETALAGMKLKLDEHNLKETSKYTAYAKSCIMTAMAHYRAFKSREMAIVSFDLSRDAAISGVLAELDSNMSENRVEGMPRLIGNARVAIRDIRRLDTKSGHPVKAFEELMEPVNAYRDALAKLRKKKEVTQGMKERVFAAMDEAKQNKERLIANMRTYGITPTAAERSALERVDAALIHNFEKIRFDAATLPLFDVDRTALWSGNALKSILTAQSNVAPLKARIQAAKEAQEAKARQDEEDRRKKRQAQEKKRRDEEEDRRRKRSRASSSSSSSSFSSGFGFD